ncbi:MAG: stage II sporulation protein R [Agathobacter sp.]|nr:stage II sporulation protein R [Agathobacter sp.]
MKHTLFYILAGAIVFLYIWTMVLGHDLLQPSIASKILRFHVLANSDSDADQAVKEKVRDAVGVYLQPLLEDAESLAETKQIVGEYIPDIVTVAENTLAENGYDYSVTARITRTDFPEKTYGTYTFPKGEYEALQIVIGEGEGQNWWCVLYPNMCFRGSVFEVVEEEAGEALKEVLSPWEYADVFESKEVKVRFKFLEFFR